MKTVDYDSDTALRRIAAAFEHIEGPTTRDRFERARESVIHRLTLELEAAELLQYPAFFRHLYGLEVE